MRVNDDRAGSQRERQSAAGQARNWQPTAERDIRRRGASSGARGALLQPLLHYSTSCMMFFNSRSQFGSHPCALPTPATNMQPLANYVSKGPWNAMPTLQRMRMLFRKPDATGHEPCNAICVWACLLLGAGSEQGQDKVPIFYSTHFNHHE